MLMSVQCVIPFKGQQATTNVNANFNTQLARLRIIAEQVIGQVKARFAALRELRIQIDTMEDVGTGGKWITAAFVLHNICLQKKDYVPPISSHAFRTNDAIPACEQPF